MIQETPQVDLFKQQLRDSLQQAPPDSRGITIAKDAYVYMCGDSDEMVYFIERG